MGKIISICGQDGTGKTTLSYALANKLASKNTFVLIIHTDLRYSSIKEHMPLAKINNDQSIGLMLMTENYNTLDRTIIKYNKNDNMFLTGICGIDDCTSYKQFNVSATQKYITDVSKLFDYVIVDTTASTTDILAITSFVMANHIINLILPNIHGLTFEDSFNELYERLKIRGKMIYSAAKEQIYNNTALIEDHFSIKFQAHFPFSTEVDRKNLSCDLINGMSKPDGLVYMAQLNKVANLVM
jgi:MinD-like ATPase involved in chromosome partitioning or flagellar assembly